MGNGEVGFSKLTGPMQVLVLLFTIMAFIVPGVLGFVNFDKRLDIQETTTDKHISKDEAKWEKTDEELDNIKDDVHKVELNQAEKDAHYAHIQKDLNDIKAMLKQWEPINAD